MNAFLFYLYLLLSTMGLDVYRAEDFVREPGVSSQSLPPAPPSGTGNHISNGF